MKDLLSMLIVVSLMVLYFLPSFLDLMICKYDDSRLLHTHYLITANFVFGWTGLGWLACMAYVVLHKPKGRMVSK